MTEEATNPDPQPEGEEADWLKQLRKDAADAKKLRGEVATLKRASAMDEVGIPKTGAGKLFRDKWDGDPDDLDALKAAASEYELIQADTPDDETVTTALNGAEGAASLTEGAGTAELTVETLLSEANSIDEIERIAQDAGAGVPIR